MPLYNPTIAFQSGVYPNTVIPTADMASMIDNFTYVTSKQFGVISVAAPAAITQATAGTWTTIFNGVYVNQEGRPTMIVINFGLVSSGTNANVVKFGLFKNNVLYATLGRFSAVSTAVIGATLTQFVTAPIAADAWQLKWLVEDVIANSWTIPRGLRITSWAI